jgi:hypothetical protein
MSSELKHGSATVWWPTGRIRAREGASTQSTGLVATTSVTGLEIDAVALRAAVHSMFNPSAD